MKPTRPSLFRARRLTVRLLTGMALLTAGAFCGTVEAQQRHALVVHLPSTPVETAQQQALAINQLAAYLDDRLPELGLESKIFRRAMDASDYVVSEADDALILCDAAFLLDSVDSEEYLPLARFQSSDRSTYRRLLVVRQDANFEHLSDLKDKRLTAVELSADDLGSHLQRRIFDDLIDPQAWFGEIRTVSDDFSATAEVLYGQSEAAIVAEFNPLLQNHLEKGDLAVLFESSELPLPVVAMHRHRLSDGEIQSLRRVLAAMADDEAGRQVLARLGWSRLSPLDADQLADLDRAPQQPGKRLQMVTPSSLPPSSPPPALPQAGTLPFLLQVELPDMALEPASLAPTDATPSDSTPPGTPPNP